MFGHCTVFDRYFDFHANLYWNVMFNYLSDKDNKIIEEGYSPEKDLEIYKRYIKEYHDLTIEINGETHTNVQTDPYRKFLYSLESGKATWVYPTVNDILNYIPNYKYENIRKMYENHDRITYLKDIVLPKLKILFYLTCDSEHMFDVIHLYANNNIMEEKNPIEEFKKIYNFVEVFNTISNNELVSFMDFVMPYRNDVFVMDRLSTLNEVLLSPIKLYTSEDDSDSRKEFLESTLNEFKEQQISLYTELNITGFDGDYMIT